MKSKPKTHKYISRKRRTRKNIGPLLNGAGELLGREEPDEVQQSQMEGPAPGEEQPHAPVQAWGGPAGEQLCGEGPGRPGG